MTNEQIRQAVLQIISVIAPDEDLTHLKSDVPLRDQLELDSMDFLDIVMELRKRYSVEVPEADYGQLRSEEHTSELQSPCNLVCRLLLEKKKKKTTNGDELLSHNTRVSVQSYSHC